MSILVVGSVALDTVKTPFGLAHRVLGGSATYFSLAARLFSPVNLVAVVGRDFPKKYITLLENKGINLEGLEVKSGKTFHWKGEYALDFSDPKTLATHLNVFADFKPRIPRSYRQSKFVFLANIDPRLQEQVLGQMRKPKLIACDTMNHWIANSRKPLLKLLRKVDILLVNESEAKQLTQQANLIKAGKKILKLGPKVAVIKKGEHGVLLFSGADLFTAPAYLLESVYDPTGAGDSFAGGFLGYLAKSRALNRNALRQAVICGSVVATFTVEDFSLNRLKKLTLFDFNQRLNQFKQYTRF